MGIRKGAFNGKNQKDYSEELLCYDCEQRLSVIEGEAIKACHTAYSQKNRRRYKIPTESIRALVAFVFIVFWRASKSKCIDTYHVSADLESKLRDAFFNSVFPDSHTLSVSISFLKVFDIEQSQGLILAPMYAKIPGSATAHYFSAFGLVFRMFTPGGDFEVDEGEFLNVEKEYGFIFKLRDWENELLDSMLAQSAVQAIIEGASSSA